MKYTVEGFSQTTAVNLGLDMVDLGLLRWLVDYHNTGCMEMHLFEDKRFFWVYYQYLMREMPILGITNKVSLGRRFKKIVKSGLLEFRVFEGAGNKTYYRFNEALLLKLLSNKTEGGIDSKVKRVLTQKSRGSLLKSKDIDSSIIDPSIIDSNINAFFAYFCLKTKKNLKLTPERKRIIKQRLAEGYSIDQLKAAVDNFIQDDWSERFKYIDIVYCIGKQNGKPDALERWLNYSQGGKENFTNTNSIKITDQLLEEEFGRIATKEMIKEFLRKIPQNLWCKVDQYLHRRYPGSSGNTFSEIERELIAEARKNKDQLAGLTAGIGRAV